MKSLSLRDLETLSAYVDGQLSPKDIRKLESRVTGDAVLRQALEDMRRTRQLLQLAPHARRRRNFTLTPEMAGRRVSLPQSFKAMRLVSVVASVLFAMVFAGDLLLGALAGGRIASVPAAVEAPMEFVAVEEAVEADEGGFMDKREEPPVPAAANAELHQERAVVEEAEEPAEQALIEEDVLEAPAEDMVEEGLGAAVLTSTPAPMGTPAPKDTSIQTFAATATLTTIPKPTATSALEIPTDADSGEFGVEPTRLIPVEVGEEKLIPPEGEEEPGIQVPFIRLIQGGLILVALISGVIALLIRLKIS